LLTHNHLKLDNFLRYAGLAVKAGAIYIQQFSLVCNVRNVATACRHRLTSWQHLART